MKHKSRIDLTDTLQSSLIKMAEGNPGALTVLMQTIKRGVEIDPDSAMADISGILALDSEGIYGSRIWQFHKDVCGCSIELLLGLLRCVQLGILSSDALHHAIDNHGSGLAIPDLMESLHIGKTADGKISYEITTWTHEDPSQ